MLNKIYKYDSEIFLKNMKNDWSKYELLYEYKGNLEIGQNIQIGDKYYRWCMRSSIAEQQEERCTKWLMEEYTYKPSHEAYVENLNNPICPICGYVDYDGWENPSGEYVCPQCKSILNLDRKLSIYNDEIESARYITSAIKRIEPKKLENVKVLKEQI